MKIKKTASGKFKLTMNEQQVKALETLLCDEEWPEKSGPDMDALNDMFYVLADRNDG